MDPNIEKLLDRMQSMEQRIIVLEERLASAEKLIPIMKQQAKRIKELEERLDGILASNLM